MSIIHVGIDSDKAGRDITKAYIVTLADKIAELEKENASLNDQNKRVCTEIAELEKERDKIDPLLMELLKCCDGLSTEFGQSNYGAANEWVRHIDNAYTKYTDAIDDASEKLLQAHNQAKALKAGK
jgi:chromosome segregation ATPase